MAKLSLWLSPPPGSPLEVLLHKLSSTYDTPKFDPHTTLVSDEIIPPSIPLDTLVEAIKTGIESWKMRESKEEWELRFKDVEIGAKFFQCIYITLFKTAILQSLHESILKALDLSVPSPATYFPHLSLVYGNLNSQFKEKILDQLEKEEIHRSNDGVQVASLQNYKPTEVLVVSTDADIDSWKVLSRIPLLL